MVLTYWIRPSDDNLTGWVVKLTAENYLACRFSETFRCGVPFALTYGIWLRHIQHCAESRRNC